MNVTLENIICTWDEKLSALFILMMNTLVFCKDEAELRQAVHQLREKTELDEYFTYGYGSHHFWCSQRIAKGSEQCLPYRLFIIEF